MNTTSTKRDVRNEVNFMANANNTVRFSAPERSAPAQTPRPAVDDDDDSQWVTQRMFDHYNG